MEGFVNNTSTAKAAEAEVAAADAYAPTAGGDALVVDIESGHKKTLGDPTMTAWVVTLLCFFPTGIPAILAAHKFREHVLAGDDERAALEHARAQHFIKVSAVIGALIWALVAFLIILTVILVFATATDGIIGAFCEIFTLGMGDCGAAPVN